MSIGIAVPEGYKYILAVDETSDSKEAIRLMTEAGLSFFLYETTPEHADAKLPLVITGFGDCEGLREIRSYIIPDPSWPARKAEMERKYGPFPK